MDFLQIFLIAIIPMIFAITVHEAAHGFVAKKLGDNTAFMMGRVTLNPLKHIDPIGTILFPLVMLYLGGVMFGWAKPVPVNWQNLHHPKRDSAFVAIAGPFSNLIMAFLWALIAKIILMINFAVTQSVVMTNAFDTFLYAAAQFGIMINGVLMILNLIPIPPLDGSRVVSSLLPQKISESYNSIEGFGIWILLALLLTGVLQWMLLPPMRYFLELMTLLFGLPLDLFG